MVFVADMVGAKGQGKSMIRATCVAMTWAKIVTDWRHSSVGSGFTYIHVYTITQQGVASRKRLML